MLIFQTKLRWVLRCVLVMLCLLSFESSVQAMKPTPVNWKYWKLTIEAFRLDPNLFYGFKGCANKDVKIKDIARGKKTSQTSTHTDSRYVSDKAVDGNLQTYSCTHGGPNQMWQIDLGNVYTIMRIEIYGRKMRRMELYIGRTETDWKLFEKYDGPKQIPDPVKIECKTAKRARYMKITNPDRKSIKIFEVKVFVPETETEEKSITAKFGMELVPKNIKHRNFAEKIKQLKCFSPKQKWEKANSFLVQLLIKSKIHRKWVKIPGQKFDADTIWRDYQGRKLSKKKYLTKKFDSHDIKLPGRTCHDYIGEFMCQIIVDNGDGTKGNYTETIHFTKTELGCITKKKKSSVNGGHVVLILILILLIAFIAAAVLWNLVVRRKMKDNKHVKKIDKVLLPVTGFMNKLPGLKNKFKSYRSIPKITESDDNSKDDEDEDPSTKVKRVVKKKTKTGRDDDRSDSASEQKPKRKVIKRIVRKKRKPPQDNVPNDEEDKIKNENVNGDPSPQKLSQHNFNGSRLLSKISFQAPVYGAEQPIITVDDRQSHHAQAFEQTSSPMQNVHSTDQLRLENISQLVVHGTSSSRLDPRVNISSDKNTSQQPLMIEQERQLLTNNDNQDGMEIHHSSDILRPQNMHQQNGISGSRLSSRVNFPINQYSRERHLSANQELAQTYALNEERVPSVGNQLSQNSHLQNSYHF